MSPNNDDPSSKKLQILARLQEIKNMINTFPTAASALNLLKEARDIAGSIGLSASDIIYDIEQAANKIQSRNKTPQIAEEEKQPLENKDRLKSIDDLLREIDNFNKKKINKKIDAIFNLSITEKPNGEREIDDKILIDGIEKNKTLFLDKNNNKQREELLEKTKQEKESLKEYIDENPEDKKAQEKLSELKEERRNLKCENGVCLIVVDADKKGQALEERKDEILDNVRTRHNTNNKYKMQRKQGKDSEKNTNNKKSLLSEKNLEKNLQHMGNQTKNSDIFKKETDIVKKSALLGDNNKKLGDLIADPTPTKNENNKKHEQGRGNRIL